MSSRMTQALTNLLSRVAVPADHADDWAQAIGAAARAEPPRGGKASPADRLRRLREQVNGELVAFHDRLIVQPYQGPLSATVDGANLWSVAIPLTLFPKRDRGFSR